MNILILSYEFPPLGGGGGKVVHGLTKAMIRLGYSIDIVTMGFNGLAKYEQINGADIYRVPCVRASESICHPHEMATYIVCVFPTLKRLLKRKKYALNHTHFIFPDGIISYILKRSLGLPYVITSHGSDVPGYNPDRFKTMHKFLAPVWKTVVKNTSRVICPSESQRSLVLKTKHDAPTTVIPNGIEIDKWDPSRKKQPRILVVTRMFERKGVQYVLEALKGLTHGFDVNIVGDGPYLNTLRNMAKSYEINVRFWGWLDNNSSKMKELFETSRIFVFPSEAENFPIVLLEAMTAGMAIITTSGTGCSEVVGDSALLVKPRSAEGIRGALNTLIGNPVLCEKLGSSSRKRLEDNFSWKAVAQKYSEVFQSTALL